MHPEIQRTTVLVAILLLGLTLELIRRNRLLEDYAVLWFLLGGLLLAFGLVPDSLFVLARLTGVVYPPSAIFIGALLLCLALIMHFSVVITQLRRQTVRLTQIVALLGAEHPPD